MSVRPKSKCCDDRPRCRRCPIRLLSEGQLSPDQARAIFAKGRNRKLLTKAQNKKARKKQKKAA
ncbi:hypothetical protein ACQBAR_09600 [Propionibacteriaceae bacterium Y1685]|uniref:hypothetical protein n=1 Tax=Microlunatus sp. Y1700 TaxID=3418487 RepID=UPI003B8180FD